MLAPPPTASPAEAPAPLARADRDACGPLLPKARGGTWSCTFVDRFAGGSLDRDHWIVQDSARSGFRYGRTCFVDSPDVLEVSRGRLVITVVEGGWHLCGVRAPFFTRWDGGMIGTKGHFSQAYGRFEIRAKLPAATHLGIHGGFWMYPVELTYGGWPASGEIDVAEWWSRDPQAVLPSLHYNGRRRAKDSGRDCRVDDPTVFHNYTLVWGRDTMRFLIDGDQCFSRRWQPDPPQVRPQPFDHPFSMILNMGVTSRVDPNAEFPARFVVDHAKAWR